MRVFHYPARGNFETRRQKRDIKTQMRGQRVNALFLSRHQVEEQCPQPCALQHPRDMTVSRAVTTAAAAMGEKHQAEGVGGNFERACELHVPRDSNFALPGGRRLDGG